MYYRIKNKFEVDLLHPELERNNVPSIIQDRMLEITDVLDSDYGATRSSTAYGGYVLYFPTCDDYSIMAPVILQNYNIDPNLAEYDDLLWSSTAGTELEWHEELFLMSSEDSLVFIFPKLPGA